MKKHIIISLLSLLLTSVGYAHEPLYGLGPETLPKYLNAIEFGARYGLKGLEYELGYGFGITQNWTTRIDFSSYSEGSSFGLGEIKFRTKYALWRKMSPGVLKRLTVIAALKIPTAKKKPGSSELSAFTIGLANGYESRRWYYFSDIGYTFLKSGKDSSLGGKLKYNLVGGIRPVKSDYLKPDLVLLVELNGEFSRKTQINGAELPQSGGNTLAVAPGFLLSYRNIMLKAGIQFGIANTKYVNKPTTNGLVSLEYHF